MSEETWRDKAACRTADNLAIFFPEDLRNPQNATREAKSYCRVCRVQAQCLELGLDERYGVFGGLSAWERARVRTKKAGVA